VVCGGHGKDIAVFDVAKGTLHRALKGHSHPATAIAFLPDGRLASGGEERTLRLWDLNLGQWLATWIAWPADPKQHWADEWIGFTHSGQFAGSNPPARLVGWQVDGDTLIGGEAGDRRRKVDRLFQAPPTVSTARD
jgi:WD40 repeat protein